MRVFLLLVLHEVAVLRRNKKVLWSQVLTVSAVFLIFIANVREGQDGVIVLGFFFMLLLMGVGTAGAIGLYAFVGEKEGRTMEPLLLLPVSLHAVVAAKFTMAVGLALTELAVFYFGAEAVIRLWGEPGLYGLVLTPVTRYVVAVLAPLLAVLFALVAIAVSGWSRSSQNASFLMAMISLPLMLTVVAIVTKVIILTERGLLVATLLLMLLNLIAYRIALAAVKPEILIKRVGQ